MTFTSAPGTTPPLVSLTVPSMLPRNDCAAAGDAIFSHLGLLFGIGVAVGLARENHGAAGLAGAVCFLVLTEGAKALLQVTPDAAAGFTDQAARDLAVAAWKAKQLDKLGVPAGILSGLAAGMLYNRFSDIKLPDYLAFFGGRRFVPIAAGAVGLIGAVTFGLGEPYLETGIDQLSRWVVASGNFGLFAYGFLNRILIVTGLHHIINNIAWFIIGDFHGTRAFGQPLKLILRLRHLADAIEQNFRAEPANAGMREISIIQRVALVGAA